MTCSFLYFLPVQYCALDSVPESRQTGTLKVSPPLAVPMTPLASANAVTEFIQYCIVRGMGSEFHIQYSAYLYSNDYGCQYACGIHGIESSVEVTTRFPHAPSVLGLL